MLTMNPNGPHMSSWVHHFLSSLSADCYEEHQKWLMLVTWKAIRKALLHFSIVPFTQSDAGCRGMAYQRHEPCDVVESYEVE